MITYSQIDFEKDYEGVVKLCGSWWEDSLFFKLYGIKYSLNKELFEGIFKAGIILALIGKDKGKIVSCYVGVKHPYQFNARVLTATEIVWCLDKEYRTFKNLVGLLNAIEKLMVANNINLYFLAASQESKYAALEALLIRRKFNLIDSIYSKYLGGVK